MATGNSQVKMHGTARNWVVTLAVMAAIGLAGYLSFEFGRIQADFNVVDALDERKSYEDRIADLEREIVTLKQEIELQQTHRNIERTAYEDIETSLASLENKIQEYGLTSVVKIKDFTQDITSEMAKADVCLVPSLIKDPFPTTVLEAMSAGKVVIATDTGGAKEAIHNRETGFIVPSDNPKVIAATIKKLIRNRALIDYIGFNAKISYRANFTINHFNERWLAAVHIA